MADSERAGRRDGRWAAHNAARRQQIVDAAVAAIEAAPEGTEPRLQEIADRAGLVRTVVYRHFSGRGELNREVQRHIVASLRDAVLSGFRYDGTLADLIRQPLAGYVEWVDAHPKLYLAALRDPGDGAPSELAGGIQDIADRILTTIRVAADFLGASDLVDQQLTEPLVFGIIGQVRGTVEHWVRSPARRPAKVVVASLARAIWFQMEGQAKDLGVTLDPDVVLRELFASPTR